MFRFATLVFSIILAANVSSAEEASIATLSVSASSVVEAEPDLARISLGVETRARVAADALRANSADVAKLLERLLKNGISERDVQTTDLSVHPQYQHNSNTPKIVGYVVRNQLSLRIRDLELLGPLLDVLAQDGANVFNNLQFGLQDDEGMRRLALTNAIKSARSKAELMAETAGVELGRLIRMTEGSARVSPMPMARDMAMMSESAVPIASGSISASATVTLTYEVLN